jgi:hypothetical protein
MLTAGRGGPEVLLQGRAATALTSTAGFLAVSRLNRKSTRESENL